MLVKCVLIFVNHTCIIVDIKTIGLCSVGGDPTKVTWYKDNILIDNNPDYQTFKTNDRYALKIEETFVEDSAKFTCRAENDFGFSETSAYLSVKGKHNITINVRYMIHNSSSIFTNRSLRGMQNVRLYILLYRQKC